jgi:hypothetical protein
VAECVPQGARAVAQMFNGFEYSPALGRPPAASYLLSSELTECILQLRWSLRLAYNDVFTLACKPQPGILPYDNCTTYKGPDYDFAQVNVLGYLPRREHEWEYMVC